MQDYEILIKSFLRMKHLERLLKSIITYYPDVTVHIADDSVPESDLQLHPKRQRMLDAQLTHRKYIVRFIKQHPNMHLHNLPFDTGMSAGRNFLLEQVSAPYFVLMEDDFAVTQKTKLDRLHQVITSDPNIIIVGGGVADYGKRRKSPGEIIISNGNFRLVHYGKNAPRKTVAGVECMPCKFVSNFFMGNKYLFDKYDIDWAPELKACTEHALFFYSMPQEVDIYFTKECTIDHFPGGSDLYRSYRTGRLRSQQEELKKISGRVHLFGQTTSKYR